MLGINMVTNINAELDYARFAYGYSYNATWDMCTYTVLDQKRQVIGTVYVGEDRYVIIQSNTSNEIVQDFAYCIQNFIIRSL